MKDLKCQKSIRQFWKKPFKQILKLKINIKIK